MRFLLACLCLLGLSFPAAAQQALTLQESIQLAQTGSPAATIARYEFEGARLDYRSFRAGLLPSLRLTGTLPNFRRSINEFVQVAPGDSTAQYVYVEERRVFGSVNLQVDQPLPMTGGTLFLSSGLQRNEQFGDNEFVQWQASPLVVGLTQPLFRFNPLKWERRTQPLQQEIARQTFREDLEGVAVDVTNAFFDVYLAEMNVEIATFNVAVNDTVYTLSEGRYNIGRIAENDLLQSELQLLNAQTALAEATISYQRSLQALKLALGLPYNEALTVIPPLDIPTFEIDPDVAVAQAAANQAAFLNLDLDALQAEREVERARRTNGFSADVSASFGLNQRGDDFGDAYENLLNQQVANVSVSVPIWRWGEGRANIGAARAAQQATQARVALRREELMQTAYFEAVQVEQLRTQVAIAAKADTVAARRFEVARNRYAIGKIDITDLFNAQREKDTARRSFLQTLRQFWVSYYRLRQLTLYDFATGQPIDVSLR